MLATSSSDGTVGVWDLSVERDAEEEACLAATGQALHPDDTLSCSKGWAAHIQLMPEPMEAAHVQLMLRQLMSGSSSPAHARRPARGWAWPSS